MPVEELPPSNPGVFAEVSIVLPATIGALSSACAPGITAAAVPSMSVTLWPNSDTAAAPISATPAMISAYSTSAAPLLLRQPTRELRHHSPPVPLRYGFDTAIVYGFARAAVPARTERTSSSRFGNDHAAAAGTGDRTTTGFTTTISSVSWSFRLKL